jgi:hypothetical protein
MVKPAIFSVRLLACTTKSDHRIQSWGKLRIHVFDRGDNPNAHRPEMRQPIMIGQILGRIQGQVNESHGLGGI